MGKAIETFTPSNTILTDKQKQSYVPIVLLGGELGHRRIAERELTERPRSSSPQALYNTPKCSCTFNAQS